MILVRIDPRDLLQDSFRVSNLRNLGSSRLLLSDLMRVEIFDDDVFEVGCGNARNRSDRCGFGFSMEVGERDVIAVADAGLGGVGRMRWPASSNSNPVRRWSDFILA